jgi:hypothetical protein
MRLDRISARRIVWSVSPGTPVWGETVRSIGFPSTCRYLLVGTGTTVPAGVEKYLVLKSIQHINLKGLPEL